MKNFYALNPGEFFVAQEIAEKRPDLQLYFPIKDVGVDLLAIQPKGKPVSIQVKESRMFERGHTWHQVREERLESADIFIFISYVPVEKGGRTVFANDFVVVPQAELASLCEGKKKAKGTFSFYFKNEGSRLLETRDGIRDVSRFKNAWHLIS